MVRSRSLVRKIGLIVAVIGVTIGMAASAGCLEGGIQNPIAVPVVAPAPGPAPAPTPADPGPEVLPDPTPEPTPEPEPEPITGAPEVVKDICSQCHGLQDADGELIVAGRGIITPMEAINQTVTSRSWEATVDRMRDANGCEMTDEQRTEIITWLDAQ